MKENQIFVLYIRKEIQGLTKELYSQVVAFQYTENVVI